MFRLVRKIVLLSMLLIIVSGAVAFGLALNHHSSPSLSPTAAMTDATNRVTSAAAHAVLQRANDAAAAVVAGTKKDASSAQVDTLLHRAEAAAANVVGRAQKSVTGAQITSLRASAQAAAERAIQALEHRLRG